ncbi:MAG: chemotaxis protein CheW [Treponema sp.]|nr:chemotaxis protein CheW [Candidatus Treponema equifaecale]
MEAATNEKPTINSVLKESLGNLQSFAGPDAADGAVQEKKDNMVVVDYKMVTFSLAGKDYAIDIMKVKEIAKAGRFTYVPNTLPFVLGVYNLRGEIIPIIDLRLFFNIDMPEREVDAVENMLIVTIGEQTFGVVVDEIDKVVGIQKSTINPPHPLFGDINIKYIQGVVEVNNRLYILLDIERIFGSKADNKAAEAEVVKNMSARMNMPGAGAPAKKVEKKPAAPAAPEKVDYSFVVDSLSSMRKFNASPLNDKWMQIRYKEWEKERGKDKTQLQDAGDAEAFLKSFFSPCNGTWWTKEYADAVYKALPDNTAKQIVVWNPGCGKGCETYSIACLLRKRYPEAKIRIYAHEVDLLAISNAPLLSVPADVANGWYAPYITKKANGDFTFTSDVRDSIMFEYHDCANTNALPACDIIFARDVLSFLPAASQQTISADFAEKLKGNGIVVLGQNESLEGNAAWSAKTVGSITIFEKK